MILYPDNSSSILEQKGFGKNGSDFISGTILESNITSDLGDGPNSSGTIGEWTSDEDWDWVLHHWDSDSEIWVESQESSSSIIMDSETHLAWMASNSNTSMAPLGRTVMGMDG